MQQKIRLSATDTLFFRDGRPFTMGDDSWANTIFPPFPSTIYGMLRSMYFEKKLHKLKDAETENDPTKDIEIKDFVLQLEKTKETARSERIYPLPLDMVYYKEKVNGKEQKTFVLLELLENDRQYSTNELEGKLFPPKNYWDKKVRSTKGEYYITESEFEKYLTNKDLSTIKPFKLSRYLTKEPKIGISRNRFDMSDKKMYRIDQLRPATQKGKLYFIVDYETPNMLDTNRYKRLGGEGKLVYVEYISNEDKEDTTNVNIDKKRKDKTMPVVSEKYEIVKMYLATPAIEPEKVIKDNNIEIVAAVTGNPQYIGGWNMKDNEPRPMYVATPAGSVFYLKGKNLYNFISKFHNHNLEQPENFANQGFGKVYISKVNHLKN